MEIPQKPSIFLVDRSVLNCNVSLELGAIDQTEDKGSLASLLHSTMALASCPRVVVEVSVGRNSAVDQPARVVVDLISIIRVPLIRNEDRLLSPAKILY